MGGFTDNDLGLEKMGRGHAANLARVLVPLEHGDVKRSAGQDLGVFHAQVPTEFLDGYGNPNRSSKGPGYMCRRRVLKVMCCM